MLSAEDAIEPEVVLAKLALLTSDESGVQCATVAGVLLCTRHPEQWLPNAAISATRYRGTDRMTGQVDSKEITGPLQQQIADALTFTGRNMQAAARKAPARIDTPQYSEKAIFEAVVNAVVHRDYSIRSSRIRLSMFSDRLEIQSPGVLPNSLTLESMTLRQATRNEIIASAMGRMGVGDIRGSADRRYFMERRGDGVPTIIRETRELSGRAPEYRLIDDAEVLLRIPSAPQEFVSSRVVVTVRTDGQPLPGANVLVLFPNRTWKQAVSDENGEATLDLYTTELPVTVFGAALGYSAGLVREWLPATGALALDLAPMPRGGSVIFAEATGHVPGLRGRLNPIRDALERTYLYASDLSIDRGRPQPVQFVLGETFQLTDSDGVERRVRIVEIIGVQRQNFLQLTTKLFTVVGFLVFPGEKLFSLRRSSELRSLNEVNNLSVSDAFVGLPDTGNSRQIRVPACSVIGLIWDVRLCGCRFSNFLTALCDFKSVAGQVEFQDHTVMHQTVYGGGGVHRIVKDRFPLREGQVGCDQHACAFVAFCQQMEEHFHLFAAVLYIAESINDQGFIAQQQLHEFWQSLLLFCTNQCVDQLAGGVKDDPVSLIDQLLSQCTQQVRLSGAGGSQGQHIFLALQKAPLQQCTQLVIHLQR